MVTAIVAYLSAPYIFLTGLIVWLTFHKIAMAGIIGIFLLIIGGAKLLPTKIAGSVLVLTLLLVGIGWNIYTPEASKSAVEATPTPAVAVAVATSTPDLHDQKERPRKRQTLSARPSPEADQHQKA